jgi:hypothetical protein
LEDVQASTDSVYQSHGNQNRLSLWLNLHGLYPSAEEDIYWGEKKEKP